MVLVSWVMLSFLLFPYDIHTYATLILRNIQSAMHKIHRTLLNISATRNFLTTEFVLCKGKERLADTLNVSADQAKSFTNSFLGTYL